MEFPFRNAKGLITPIVLNGTVGELYISTHRPVGFLFSTVIKLFVVVRVAKAGADGQVLLSGCWGNFPEILKFVLNEG
jgi:hypothetical protein